MKHYYVTTPIYYVNSDPHIGTAYTTILADTAARFRRLLGEDAYFLTGTDEHGDKIAKAAAAKNLTPQAFVDEISGRFRILWPQLYVMPDRFIRTTDPDHRAVVESILQKLHDQGDTYFGEYEGLYCTGCERFRTEKELVDGKCPDHGTIPDKVKESNYFFRMSKYQDWWRDYIEQHPDVVRPERYRNEVLGYLREPLEDLCISRPKERLSWGIELPFDRNYVTYVWFDALLNYLSGIDYGREESWHARWEACEHLIGKDIVKPHGIYWPIMLHAAGLPVFKHLTVHGYWNFRDAKISKSSGKPIAVEPLIKVFGVDAVRYFLLREMVVGLDASFSVEAMLKRVNSDLANDFGNLFSRVAKLIGDHFDGAIPAATTPDAELKDMAQSLCANAPAWAADMKWHTLIEETLQLVRATNRYFENSAPWSLVKTDRDQAATVLTNCIEALRIAAVLLYPVMPGKAVDLLSRIGEPVRMLKLEEHARWGQVRVGARMRKGDALFPRLDEKEVRVALAEYVHGEAPSVPAAAATAAPAPDDSLITIDDFRKIDLRTAEVVAAERIAGSDKLLKLQVRIGDQARQIVAGIAEFYTPEEMVGKQIVVVANLKPAKLRGEVSEGMLLAVKWGKDLAILPTPSDAPSGSPIS
ncbi:MAG: methionine--tRNA ligase [bacterium]|nr:methionine--tRNA ligase [bacterium]